MNGLTLAGAVGVARVLAANRILTDMDISSGRIPDAGAAIIGRGLLLNDSLSSLRMSNNPMTSLGASRLLAAIEENVDSRLCMLDIQSVVVYDDVFAILARLKERLSSFRLICSDSFATRRAASTATQCDS
ncbi:hypothetical protein NP493_1151g00025 [Ridgeia piscesae]|uniref:Uncharacterized protein n=1 Tax=Ridgeia piscesae TaxID=27915 RepID=A0AAD9NJE1_RIDPI|nr:hypothetical protein NP493_1151g00025 [Ridgeia piscesae]